MSLEFLRSIDFWNLVLPILSAIAAIIIACSSLIQSKQNKALMGQNKLQLNETIKSRRAAVEPRLIIEEGTKISERIEELEDIELIIDYSGNMREDVHCFINIINKGNGPACRLKFVGFIGKTAKSIKPQEYIDILKPEENRKFRINIAIAEEDQKNRYAIRIKYENIYGEMYEQLISMRFIGKDSSGFLRAIEIRALRPKLVTE